MGLVLVVDDEADIRDLMRLNLEAAGHRVTTAGDGEEALREARAERPDVVVLDVLMPVLDGWELLERLKVGIEDGLAGVPVLIVTALGRADAKVKAGIEGAVRFIAKPFDPAELVHAVGMLLSPDSPPEEEMRREARREAMEMLARMEADRGDAGPSEEPRVRLTKLDREPLPSLSPQRLVDARSRMSRLTEKQRLLLTLLAERGGVAATADCLGTSRSNVYAGLRRIVRRLGLRDTGDLFEMVHAGLVSEPTEPGA